MSCTLPFSPKTTKLAKLQRRSGKVGTDKGQASVERCRRGNRYDSACTMLGKSGFGQVYNLTGGIIAWQKANLPLEKATGKK